MIGFPHAQWDSGSQFALFLPVHWLMDWPSDDGGKAPTDNFFFSNGMDFFRLLEWFLLLDRIHVAAV